MDLGSSGEVRVLDTSSCWSLLRSTDIGRVASIVLGRPEIFPINYVVDHGTLVFRSASGLKLVALQEDTVVAFEVDGVDHDGAQAWSVVVHGRLEPLISFEPLDTETLPLHPLQPGPKPRFIRIVPDSITGRQFRTVVAVPTSEWSRS